MSIADDLVEACTPWLTPDLETYLRTAGDMFAEVEDLAFDTDTDDGWTILFDVDRARSSDLPFLAMIVGERLAAGLIDSDARAQISDTPNRRRGAALPIFEAAIRTLTGDRLVSMKERFGSRGPNVDQLTIITYNDQTPDPARVLYDLLEVVPADIALFYRSLPGEDWDLLRDGHPTWQDVLDDFADWEEVRTTQVGFDFYVAP